MSDNVGKRVAALLSEMTLDEKLAQLGSRWVYEVLTDLRYDPLKAYKVLGSGIGHITRLAGASSLAPEAAAETANAIQRYLVEETRLGIPALMHEESCAGYMARNATCFPQTIGTAATWEPDLIRQLAEVARVQMRAAGAHQALAPLLDITRDPRWGRVEETYGEDPYLVSAMGVAFIRGMQGDDMKNGIISTGKHFVGYGAPEGGMNWAPCHIPPRELREVYMVPFEAGVKEASLRAVMNGYHELDGVPCVINKSLLQDTLREAWGFDGVVVSDYFAINEIRRTHKLTSDPSRAASLALHAGIDIELPSTDFYGGPLREAVTSGRIEEALIDQSVARLLTQKLELGLFDNPYVDPAGTAKVFDIPEQRALAREIARKSMVLLKNEGDLLPLSAETGSIAVIGPHVKSTRHLIGDYAYLCHVETLIAQSRQGGTFDTPIPDRIDVVEQFVPMRTIWEGLEARLGEGPTLLYAKGCEVTGDDESGIPEAVAVARNAEVALVFVGGKSGLADDCTCGESRDRADLSLSGAQEELVREVSATGTPTVVVLVNGRPLTIEWITENIPTVLEAWLPGEEGAEAIAEVLFGDVSPGGKLPITFPRSVGQVPIFHGHKPSGGHSTWKNAYVETSNLPRYPFGFGLSYTTFELSELTLDRDTMKVGESVTVAVIVKNTGKRTGDEVVQLYTRDPEASVTRPLRELKGFKRVTLEAGASSTVRFTLHANQLGFYDQDMRYVLEPGEIRIMVGTSSDDLPLHTAIEIVGDTEDIGDRKVFFSGAQEI